MKAQKTKTFTDTFLSMDTTFSRIFLLITAISVLTVEGVILATMISGCDAQKPKSIEYYKDHMDEAKSIVSECNANQTNDENCVNANAAIFRFSGKKPIRGNEPHIKTW